MGIVRIQNPSSDSYFPENILAKDSPQGSHSIIVNETKTFNNLNGWFIIGNPTQPMTEMVRVLSVQSDGKEYQVSPSTKNDHLQGTPIFFTYYNVVEFYRDDGEGNKEKVGTTIPIDWTRAQTEISDPEKEALEESGKTLTYTATFVNDSTNKKTEEKPATSTDEAGYSMDDRFVPMTELIRQANKLAFNDYSSENRDDSEWILDFNQGLSDIYNDIIIPNDDQYIKAQTDIQIVAGKNNYLLPEDMDVLRDVRLDGCTIDRMSLEQAEQKCGIRCSEEVKKEPEWDYCCNKWVEPIQEKTYNECCIKQKLFYSLTDSEIFLIPVPTKNHTLSLSYFGLFPLLNKDSKGILLPRGFRSLLMARALFYFFFFSKDDAGKQERAIRMNQWYQEQKKSLEYKINRRGEARRATRRKPVYGTRATGFNQSMTNITSEFHLPSRLRNW